MILTLLAPLHTSFSVNRCSPTIQNLPGGVDRYLLAHSHGRAVDFLRSDVARRKREELDVRRTATAGYDLERQVWDLALADRIRLALNTLPDEERKPIELAYFGGRSYRDVAVELDIPEGTIKSRIRAGLRRLRAELNAAGVGADA